MGFSPHLPEQKIKKFQKYFGQFKNLYYLCITNQNKEYMKIELKNIKVNLTFSQETVNFIADLFVDGIKVACENSGCGGSSSYCPYPGKRVFVKWK